MARPNVTVIVDDQSFFIPGTESGAIGRGGMPSYHGLLNAVGYTAERVRGEMTIDSVTDWFARLNSNDPIGSNTLADAEDQRRTNAQGQPFYHLVPGSTVDYVQGNSYAGATFSRWSRGPTGCLL